jgi:putative PIN family toxin of toxin-antitoxin system
MSLIVVFDTNIFLSALLSPQGNPAKCLRLANQGRIHSITCQEIIDEFNQKLTIKLKYSVEDSKKIINHFLNYSKLVEITNTLRVVVNDPDDNKIIECVVVGQVTHIITEDKKHLLPLKNYQSISIISATDFIRLFP